MWKDLQALPIEQWRALVMMSFPFVFKNHKTLLAVFGSELEGRGRSGQDFELATAWIVNALRASAPPDNGEAGPEERLAVSSMEKTAIKLLERRRTKATKAALATRDPEERRKFLEQDAWSAYDLPFRPSLNQHLRVRDLCLLVREIRKFQNERLFVRVFIDGATRLMPHLDPPARTRKAYERLEDDLLVRLRRKSDQADQPMWQLDEALVVREGLLALGEKRSRVDGMLKGAAKEIEAFAERPASRSTRR